MKWQPIETAPEGDDEILVAVHWYHRPIIQKSDAGWWRIARDQGAQPPLAWMPLPELPQTPRQDEEEPQGSDTEDAASSDISLTHINNLETTIELLLEEAERRKEEISCLHRQISDLQDQLAKSCCRSAGF